MPERTALSSPALGSCSQLRNAYLSHRCDAVEQGCIVANLIRPRPECGDVSRIRQTVMGTLTGSAVPHICAPDSNPRNGALPS